MEVMCLAEFGEGGSLPLRLKLTDKQTRSKTCGDVLEVLRQQAEKRRPGGFPAGAALVLCRQTARGAVPCDPAAAVADALRAGDVLRLALASKPPRPPRDAEAKPRAAGGGANGNKKKLGSPRPPKPKVDVAYEPPPAPASATSPRPSTTARPLLAGDATTGEARRLADKARYRRALGSLALGDLASAKRDHGDLGPGRPSCIAPTTTERHAFHGAALYASFAAQTHDNRELVVVDTGPAPSPFFTTPGSPGKEDNRVIYTHAVHHATIGGKRNVALRLATGDVVAHFDDDDVYAPTYLATMLGAMAAQDAKFVKLSAWFVHDMGSGAWGHFDIDGFDARTELGARLRLHPNLAKLSSQFLLTYGFSFVYEKSLFPAFTFVDTNWGEDQAILAELNRVGVPVAFHADREGICIHNQHGENCSRSFCHTAVDVAAFTRAGSPLKRGVDEAIPLIRDTLYRGRNAVQPIRQRSDAPCVSHLEGGLFIWETQLALVAGGRDPAADDRAAKESDIPNFKGSYLGHFPLADDAPVRETFRAFETWIYSGNGFSQERYAKLKLERPDPPDRLVDGDDDAGVEAAVGHGLEQLRAREGLDHAPGAIVNPDAYRDGGIANPN
ncbi:hypothetical protein JL720_10798 [Aureococcus anophagefferens]|nr:hypothetical protein JL720_10798 [Aureococcus anophagefferens]